MTTNQTTANNQLKLILNATAWANIADNAAAAPATSIYAALHTADPTATGNQTSGEVTYTGYARVAVARTSSGFTVPTVGVSSPVSNITFPTGSGGSGNATFASLGMLSGGAGIILWSGPISPTIVTGSGVTPALSNASTVSVT
jgi:hypothetical protein